MILADTMPKRKSFTAKFKLEACAYAEANGYHAAAKQFTVDEKSAHKWRQNKASLKQMNPRSGCIEGMGLSGPISNATWLNE